MSAFIRDRVSRGFFRIGTTLIAFLFSFGLPAAAEEALARYSISVGDALQLDILDDAVEPFPLAVGNDGAVQLPLLGSLSIAGLTLQEAHAAIDAAYVAGEVFLEPRTDLSVVALRPVSVIGDVQNPGFFDYRANMSAEQAIGLAGGLLREEGGEESRSLQRIAIRGELAANEDAIVREAVAEQRLLVQLADGTRIDPAAIRPEGITDLDQNLIRDLILQDEEIIAAEREFNASERALYERAISEIRVQIDLMEQQVAAQESQIGSYDEELTNSDRLMERGLMSLPARNSLLREVADEETALLRLQTALIATQRELTANQRVLLGLTYQRKQDWRVELAAVRVREAQLREARASLLQRLELLADWSRAAADGDVQARLELALRRRDADGAVETLRVTETDLILPGDVLIVRMIRDTPATAAATETMNQGDAG